MLPGPRRDQLYRPSGAALAPGAASNRFREIIIVPAAGGGLFVYSPSVGANNLIESVGIPVTTSDPYGNAVFAGSTTYEFAIGTGYWAFTKDGTSLTWRLNTVNQQLAGYGIQDVIDVYQTANPAIWGLSLSAVPNMLPPGIFDGPLVAQLNIPPTPSPGTPGSGTILWMGGNGGIRAIFADGNNTRVSWANPGATNVNTVTQNTFHNLSLYSYTPNDATGSAEYRFMISGYGTWGSTAQDLTLQPYMGASVANLVGSSVTIAAASFPVNTPFFWEVMLKFVAVTTGVTGTWRVFMSGTVGQVAASLTPSSGSVSFAMNNGATDITLDTTAAQSFGLAAMWASTTGAPTISKNWSIAEILGR